MKKRLQQAGYALEPLSNIWSRTGYDGIAYSDGDETEQRIATIIKNASDVTVLSTELRQQCTDWASLYHLSPTRANILRPFNNILQSDVLEIGAGCGAITRYLGECGANVLALEGSPRRAAIAKSRTRDLSKVTVLAEKFDQFQCDHQFDVITLIGVLEYANLFTTGATPAQSMLERVRSLLKPAGKLIIAIENQLGLKYFAGAPEDHVGQPMYGIEERYRSDQPQTFGRAVLADMLKQSGFASSNFLSPLPDYKLPVSILTEDGVDSKDFDAGAFAWQSVQRDPQLPSLSNFSMELVWPTVFANQLAIDLANSFLIVASPQIQVLVEEDVLAYHYSTDRSPEFCRETVFRRDKTGKLCLKYNRLFSIDDEKSNVRLIKFICPAVDNYYLGKPLSFEFIKIVTRDGWTIDEVAQFIKRYLYILEDIAEKLGEKIYLNSPYSTIPGNFFDAVPQNMIVHKDGSVLLIDKEWELTSPIELGHLLFRVLLLSIGSITRFGSMRFNRTMTRGQFIDSVLGASDLALNTVDYDRYIGIEERITEQVTGRPAKEAVRWWPEHPLLTLNLNHAVAERDNQIGNLNHAVAERDNQIGNLNHAVAERDNQIGNLNHAVAERDNQIGNLNHAVAERDNQIGNLNHAVAERDNQIGNLNHAVTERDNQIASLKHSESANTACIAVLTSDSAALRNSLSWRLTGPVRFLGRPVVASLQTYKLIRHAVRLGGGYWSSAALIIKVLSNEGFEGVKWRLKNSRTLMGNESLFLQSPKELPETVDSTAEYVPILQATPLKNRPVKLICFYLPQFHPIPENNAWWGEGFTEWTNVQPAQPQFEGHYQPHVPGELGYYNLLDPAVQRRQVELAKLYGIEGFCFYFYWFGGKRLLETPIQNYLNDSSLSLPFCLCWANENWSRRWDGLDGEILIAQQYSAEDDLAFIRHVASYMSDPRYIRVDGKPLLLVYRPNLLPSAKETASRWRNWCRVNGIGEIYLAYTQSFECVNPEQYGFDAAVEFPPNNSAPPNITGNVTGAGSDFGSTIYDWRAFVERSEHYKQSDYTLFRSVCPAWDNTARRKNRGTVFLNSTPMLYQRWLENAIRDTQAHRANRDERLVFVNAWNEWAEGAHLEPDARYGYAHLNATLRALLACDGGDAYSSVTEETSSRHKSVLDVRWNRVAAYFDEAPERGLYEYLCDYVALLAQAAQHGALFSLKNHVPCCEINGEKIVLDRRETLSRLGASFNHKGIFCFVILQYNKVELTEQCVASLRKLDDCGRDVRVVIVDNKSSDGVRVRTQVAFGSAPDVTVLYSDVNLGFSGGNNLGYAHAREKLGAEFMVILNNDTVIEQDDFIREAVELYSSWGFSIAGPDIITPDGRHENPWNDFVYSIDEWKNLRSIRQQERAHYLGRSEAVFRKIGKSTPKREILLNPILQGAAYIVSPVFINDHKKVFDERLFLYGEEFLLAIDCLLSGHLTIYTNKLEVRHHEGASTGDLPPHDKLMLGYDSAIKAINLSLKRLERQRAASLGRVIDFVDIERTDDNLDHNFPNVLVDLLFCQPGYHGGGEYGKAVFKALAEDNTTYGGFQLWAALDPNLFIDSWVFDACKASAINIVAVRSYDEIIQIVNSDRFDSFFTPAIVVYTGYEYMSKVGSQLPFTCNKTRVIGTLHDIRDFELACSSRRVLETRRNIGCVKESKMSESEIHRAGQMSLDHAEALRRMYRALVEDKTIDMIVTISSYCNNSIKHNVGSPRKPLKVLTSPPKFRLVPEPFVSDSFNPTTTPYALVLHAARVEKNGASAVVAFDQIFEENNHLSQLIDFHIVLTGIRHLDELGLAKIRHADRFIVLSELSSGRFEYLLKNAKFLVYPSFNEGFGYPPVEAMTYGVPSIVSNTTAIPEVCGSGVKYFDPYDLESIKGTILEILVDGIKKEALEEQYNVISERQSADLKTLVGLIIGKNRFDS